jgi:Beta-propeller repeat
MRTKKSFMRFLVALARSYYNSRRILGFSGFLLLAISSSTQAQDGNLLWAKRAGSGGAPSIPQDVGQAIAVDGLGNSYVTGQFRNTATFGPGESNQTILTATGASQEIFVAKYNPSGALQWAQRINTVEGQGNGIGVDAAANVYLTGYFNFSGTFAPGEGNQSRLQAWATRQSSLRSMTPTAISCGPSRPAAPLPIKRRRWRWMPQATAT